MKIKSGLEKDYASFRERNTQEGYGSAIIRYAERWSEMMEQQMEKGATVAEAAEETQYTADTDRITGFMYGCAVQTLSEFWEHGEELREWHNHHYDYDGQGVVNPAVLTIAEPDTEGGGMSPQMGM